MKSIGNFMQGYLDQRKHKRDEEKRKYEQYWNTLWAQAAMQAAQSASKPDPIKEAETAALIFELMSRGFSVYELPKDDPSD